MTVLYGSSFCNIVIWHILSPRKILLFKTKWILWDVYTHMYITVFLTRIEKCMHYEWLKNPQGDNLSLLKMHI